MFIFIFALEVVAFLSIYIDLIGVNYLFSEVPLWEKEPQRQFLTFIAIPIFLILIALLYGLWIAKQTQYSTSEKAALVVTAIFSFFLAVNSVWQLIFFPLYKGSFDIDLNKFDQPFATPWFVVNTQIKWMIMINGIAMALFLILMYDVFVDRKASPVTNMVKAIVFYSISIFLIITLSEYYTSLQDFSTQISDVWRWIGIIGLSIDFVILTFLLPYLELHSHIFRKRMHIPGVIDVI